MIRLEYTVKRAQLLKINAQVSSIWAKVHLDDCVCVLSDLTLLPLLRVGRKSWYIYNLLKVLTANVQSLSPMIVELIVLIQVENFEVIYM